MASSAGALEKFRNFRESGCAEAYDGAYDDHLFHVPRSAGIDHPESSDLVHELLESALSSDPVKRMIGVDRLQQCLRILRVKKQTQVRLNLAAFLLQKGLVRAVAAGLKEVAAGEWLHIALEKNIALSSTSTTVVGVNKALTYAQCLAALSLDPRCVAFILKEFPDVAKVAKSIFLMKMSDRRTGPQVASEFQRNTRGEIVKLQMYLMQESRSYRKKLAEDTAFLKEILKYAESIKDEKEEEHGQAHFICCGLLFNAASSQKADLRALRTNMYELVGNVLAYCKSKERIDVAIRLLCMTIKANADNPLLSAFPTLGSSLLALHSLGDQIGGALERLVLSATQQFWRKELQHLSAQQIHSALADHFRADKLAVRRSVQLRKMFLAPSEERCEAYYVEERKAKRTEREEGADSTDFESSNMPFKLRHVDCRRCSYTHCGEMESVAGSYKMCGKCKIAVYCSRECQKLAWKEGHKELCH